MCFLLNVVCVYFALFTFERIFVLELHQSNQDTLTARFVLSCGQQLPSSCCSAVSMACLIFDFCSADLQAASAHAEDNDCLNFSPIFIFCSVLSQILPA